MAAHTMAQQAAAIHNRGYKKLKKNNGGLFRTYAYPDTVPGGYPEVFKYVF